jgi:hypothetical protein
MLLPLIIQLLTTRMRNPEYRLPNHRRQKLKHMPGWQQWTPCAWDTTRMQLQVGLELCCDLQPCCNYDCYVPYILGPRPKIGHDS